MNPNGQLNINYKPLSKAKCPGDGWIANGMLAYGFLTAPEGRALEMSGKYFLYGYLIEWVLVKLASGR